jgi:ABC-type nitrate/sulfonate/bicarbonate transport system substrate-binding protein
MQQPMPAQAAAAIKLLGFAGASNWPVWVGQTKGFFARNGLSTSLAITPNSTQMARDMASGAFDIALTSIDNVVAYVERQAEVEVPGASDFVAFLGIDDGMLSLMAAPGIASMADLKGRVLSVDALTTGFAFVLREALIKSGIGLDQVTIEAVGGGAQRLAALLDGRQAATLLNAPLDLLAEHAGAVRLADMSSIIGSYQGVSAMARRAWLDLRRSDAVAFVRAFHASLGWLTDPANRNEATAILRANLANTPPELAERIYARLTDPERGIRRDLSIDEAGLQTVLRLRSTYVPQKHLTDPGRYVDMTIRAEAGL